MSELPGERVPKAETSDQGQENENRVINRILLGFMEESQKMRMTEPTYTETHTVEVMRIKNLKFNLTAGPIDQGSEWNSGKKVIEDGEDAAPWFVLQIEYAGADKQLKDSLPLSGWSSNSSSELARAANKIAQEFCDKNGFSAIAHINSWPDFKALIYKNETVPVFASEEEEEEWHEERRRKLEEELDLEDDR